MTLSRLADALDYPEEFDPMPPGGYLNVDEDCCALCKETAEANREQAAYYGVLFSVEHDQ